MNKILLVLMIFFLSLAVCHAQNTPSNNEWKEYVSSEGKFKAVFPAAPQESVKEIAVTPSVKRYNYWFIVDLPGKFYAVNYSDYPTLKPKNQEELKTNYDILRDGVIKGMNAKLISERDIQLNGKSGREIIVSAGDEFATVQLYLVEKRLFQVITTVKSSLKENTEIKKSFDKFFDSFQISDK